ncbi:hypothetical protein SELMODRAFT_431533 [Selaginella moellendorffii]|uniref:Uncharacterized protein n=1 Tax=Selaginella moellendorffii TaxID=88036 RepID=D8TCZ1_SELML|nr:hypothetical protein SELMODRAFT_431533 [Selaginella moellendorffii]
MKDLQTWAHDHEERVSIIASGKSTSVVDFRSYFPSGPFKEPWNDLEGYSQLSKAQDTVVNGHAPENDNHLTDAEAFFNRRIIEFVKKRVTLMEKVLNAEYHLVKESQPPYHHPCDSNLRSPEEVLGRALDNNPKWLKVPAYYNEVVFVSPFAKLCSMISENRLDAFQTYVGNKSTGIRLRRFSRLEPRLESRLMYLYDTLKPKMVQKDI